MKKLIFFVVCMLCALIANAQILVKQKVLLKECIQSVGLYNKTFYISDLPHGMYFLLYQNGMETTSIKLIKQ